MHPLALRAYYHLRPFVPRPVQIALRRLLVRRKLRDCRGVWPVHPGSGRAPERWSGWPGGARFALVLTHDVETRTGLQRVPDLMQREQDLGFVSSFNFVPERYEVPPAVRDTLARNGFEVGVHGLRHDGRLFVSRRIFRRRLPRINRYLREWQAAGFYAASMLHRLDWISELEVVYDSSTYDTDPFEPQPDGAGTIFPYLFARTARSPRLPVVELPYTMPQDLTLFVLMRERDIDIWTDKLRWIVEQGGMVLMRTHPDYMNLEASRSRVDEYPGQLYLRFLEHLRSAYGGQYWHVLPRDMARFWLQRLERPAAGVRQ